MEAGIGMALEGKTVVITGAAGSLGRAVAQAFEAAGANRLLLDIDGDGLASAYGGDTDGGLLFTADLADRASIEAACQAGIEAFKTIDVACNIAGGFAMGDPVHETPMDLWQRMMDMNAVSMINTCAAVVPHMLAAGGGKIVNFSSKSGKTGSALMCHYSSKGDH